jgi:hypothetical protein
MLPLENFQMADGNDLGRGAHGRAGIDPRQKPSRAAFPSTCADSLAQLQPLDLDVRTCLSTSRATGRGSPVTNHSLAQRPGFTGEGSLATRHCISNRYNGANRIRRNLFKTNEGDQF